MRTVLHSDLNTFFASVELRKFPELREKPVAVGGDEKQRHGIVLAKNEAAKKFFIKTGETLWQAKKKCPQLIILPPHYDEYMYFSRAMREIYYQYTDMIEPFGIDEAWLDVSNSLRLWQEGKAIAEEIRARAKQELGLTVSVGVSFNKVFAKLGSDMKKPDAVTEITVENYRDKVWPQPIGNLLYVGRATENALRRRGIITIGDLAETEPSYLLSFLGKNGLTLHNFALGMDISPVEKYHGDTAAKSIGNGVTMPYDMHNCEEAKPLLALLADNVAARCRRSNVMAKGISLHIKDSCFESRSMQCVLPQPSALSDDFYYTALALLEKNYLWGKPLRAISLTAVLADESKVFTEQSLFNNSGQRMAAEIAVDEIRSRFGKDSIQKAITLNNSEHGFRIEDHCSLKA